MKWRELYKDLKNVLLKHVRPPKTEAERVEVGLVKSIIKLQQQQKDLNKIRDGFGDLARQLKDDDVFRELDKLAKMAPTDPDSCEPVARSEDVMFR